ncbi:MAG: hypothetical protein OXC48_08405, partial [Endozoicomonadaceae bacterium]|nr:hypothetical protein [Endozoicomonadaceae bacterium]
TNHVLHKVDAAGKNTIRYHYDLWDRLVEKDVNVGTPFATKTYYQYTVSPQHDQLIVTDANGLQSKIIFDGAGRFLVEFREALSDDGKAITNHWIPVNKIIYDNYGRVIAKSAYLISVSGKMEALTTTQEYDDSGRIIHIHHPDGKTDINNYDDTQRCAISYQQSATGRYSAISVTRANILYKPVKWLLIPENTHTIASTEKLCNISTDKTNLSAIKVYTMTYDGFGRIVASTDPLGNIVKKEYDGMGRVTNIIDPKGDKKHNIYDLVGHVIQRYAQPASGGNYLLFSAEYNAAGELLWNAGEDSLPTEFTYTKEGKLATSTTPDGHLMALQYNTIGLPVSEFLDKKPQLRISYDPVTLQVTAQTDNTGKTLFTYSDDGLMTHLQHLGIHNYPNYTLQWKYDRNRRVISVTDINADQTENVYDSLGRIKEIDYQQYHQKPMMLSAFSYDDFSRIITVNYGSGMQRKFDYDPFGRSKNISDTLNNKLLSTWSFTYDKNDNIIKKFYQTNNNQQAILNYKYDVLDNLTEMTCNGSSGLPLCPRDTDFSGTSLQKAPIITRQDYYFTPLNRIAQIHESLQSVLQNQSLEKTIHYDYTNPSVPLRLQRIGIMWNHQPELIHNFKYDVVGNMTTDEEGNHIKYNAFNQITGVIKPDGEQSYYDYDGNGREVYEKSHSGIRELFYRGSHLINEKISTAEEASHTIGYQDIAKTIDGSIQQYTESNYKGDVISVLKKNTTNNNYKLSQRNIYSPYGMCWHINKNSLPAYQQTLFGFDGERTDPATGWQFLGNGHRTYNPKQRYFVSEDPAGGGYGFASNNPIMNSDPSGNMPKWLGSTFKWANYICSFGLGALHKKWANIAGAVACAALTVATLGSSAYTYGGTLLAAVVAAGATLVGSVPVVAAAIPANKGLSIAAAVAGMTEAVCMFATAAVDVGLYLFTPEVISLAEEAPEETLSVDASIAETSFITSNVTEADAAEVGSAAEVSGAGAGRAIVAGARSARKVGLSGIGKRINQTFPDLVTMINGKPFLHIDSFDQLNDIYNVHSDIMECDSVAMMTMAKVLKQPIDLEDLENFFRGRARAFSIVNPTCYAERRILKYYFYSMNVILRKLSDDELEINKLTGIQALSLKEIPINPGEIIKLDLFGHTQIVGKFSDNIYITFAPYKNGIFFQIKTLDELESMLFDHLPLPERRYQSFIKF